MKFKELPPLSYLQEYLWYEPETGLFFWKKNRFKRLIGACASNRVTKWGYVHICIEGREYYAHRLAWAFTYGSCPLEPLDHKNGVKTDNRIENLRITTPTLNLGNMKRHTKNRCGFKGACLPSDKRRYRARITKEGKTYWLGYFDTPEDAHNAYCEMAIKLYGDHARFA